jgi:hypothetical protein
MVNPYCKAAGPEYSFFIVRIFTGKLNCVIFNTKSAFNLYSKRYYPALKKRKRTMIEWHMEGIQYGSCNCDHACPCQFEGLPTYGNCQGFDVFRVDKGSFDGVDLHGVVSAALFAWPGPIFEGKGTLQLVIDDRASEEQRMAMEQVLLGKETVEAGTHWWVFSAMSDTIHETLIRRIDYAVDMEARTASVHIEGLLDSNAESIKSPLDGSAHQVRIQIPHGIEFETAEIVNSKTLASGPIKLDLDGTYGQLCHIKHTNEGPAYNQ